MIKIRQPATEPEENVVTDIRRIRERLSAECGNDVFRLAQRVTEIADGLRDELELKFVPAPKRTNGPRNTTD